MCVLTVLSRDDDDGDQQGGAQRDQAEGGEAVRLGDSQWANWSESGTNWEETWCWFLNLFFIVQNLGNFNYSWLTKIITLDPNY